MPAPKRTGHSSEYLELKYSGINACERNDCTVIALAAAAGISYEEARADLKAMGRKSCTGAWKHELDTALLDRGFSVRRMVDPQWFISRYPKAHRGAKNLTTHHPERFNKVWRDGCTYLAYVDGFRHVLVIKNGENLDWTKGCAKRITYLYRVEEITK